MKKCDCPLCKFENPKVTATAVVIKDQKILVGKRSQKGKSFYGKWDFFGGYLQKNETPEEGLKREIKEELDVDCEPTFLGTFTGTDQYAGFGFPIISFAYLTELKGKIKLEVKENSELAWVPIAELTDIAFNSNQKILKFIKEKNLILLQLLEESLAFGRFFGKNNVPRNQLFHLKHLSRSYAFSPLRQGLQAGIHQHLCSQFPSACKKGALFRHRRTGHKLAPPWNSRQCIYPQASLNSLPCNRTSCESALFCWEQM